MDIDSIARHKELFDNRPRNSEAPPTVEQLMSMFNLYVLVHNIALCVAFLRLHAFCSAGCISDHKIKAEVDSAIAYLDQEVDTLSITLEAPKYNAIRNLGLPWVMTVEQVRDWQAAAASLRVAAKRAIVQDLMNDAYALAERVGKLTPQFAHVVNDQVYHPNLAKKNLLRETENEQLTKEVVTLCATMAGVANLHTGWRLKPPFKDDPAYLEKRSFCDSAFAAGKQALILVAAVKILDMGDTPLAQMEAQGLLVKRRGELPPPLVERLSMVAKLKGGGGGSASSAKDGKE